MHSAGAAEGAADSGSARSAMERRSIVGLGLKPDFRAQLAQRYELHEPPATFDPDATVIVVQHARVDAGQMARQPGLKLIGTFGVGYDRVDVDAARRLGVTLFNTPGVTSACVADMAMALLLAAARRVLIGDRDVRAGHWSEGRRNLARRFSGRRLGIFGLGAAGLAIAKRAAGFDLDVRYHNRRPRGDVPYRYFDTLEGLTADSDYLVIACPATAATFHRVDARVLAALGPEGVVVNIARGSVVDEAALIRALRSGAIGSAGLDVFEHEPEIPAALVALDNVVLTPHIAGHTREVAADVAALICANLDAWFATGQPLTPVAL